MRKGSLRSSHAGRSSVPMFDERRESVRRGTLVHVLHEGIYGFVGQVADEVRLDVRLAAGGEKRVKHTLQLYVADGGEGVGERWTKGPQGFQHLFALRDRSTVASGNA